MGFLHEHPLYVAVVSNSTRLEVPIILSAKYATITLDDVFHLVDVCISLLTGRHQELLLEKEHQDRVLHVLPESCNGSKRVEVPNQDEPILWAGGQILSRVIDLEGVDGHGVTLERVDEESCGGRPQLDESSIIAGDDDLSSAIVHQVIDWDVGVVVVVAVLWVSGMSEAGL